MSYTSLSPEYTILFSLLMFIRPRLLSMGNLTSSSSNELLKRSNVKLQAQQVVAYDGNSIKWHSWNKKMKAAVGTAGMLRVLEDSDYAESHKVDNETIFHLLQVATADGNAAHLVDKHESEKDGHAAYQELVKWFEGDELTTETAEDVRSKLDKLRLTTKITASKYINQFLQYRKHLEELSEEYTPSKTVNIFLMQIMDPDFESTVEHCLENKLDINECIERIRAKERRLDRQRGTKSKVPIVLRRQEQSRRKENTDGVIRLEDYKTYRGYYSIPTEDWTYLSNDDKEFVKSHNGKLRRKREEEESNEGGGSNKRSRVITSRRNTTDSKNHDDDDRSNKKTIQFKDDNDVIEKPESNNKSEHDPASNKDRNIPRRGALTFKTKDNKSE